MAGIYEIYTGTNDNWQELLADDVGFIDPVMQVLGKESYIKTSLEFFQIVRGFDLISYVANEDFVATTHPLSRSSHVQAAFPPAS